MDDERDVHPFLENASNVSESASGLGMSGIDWYGNTSLHHSFANNEIVLPSICKVLERFPEYACMRNQFGRIPLHYALDRIRVNYDGVKKLIEAYPEGVHERDNDNKTPYDVAVRWKHSKAIKKLLLDADPSLDKETHFKIKYGFLAVMYNMMACKYESEPKRNRIYSTTDVGGRSPRGRDVEVLDSVVPFSGSSPRVNNTASSVPEVDSTISLVPLESQVSSLTSRGDISEASTSNLLPSNSSRMNLSMSAKEGRRTSVPDILEEEESFQLGY